MLPHRNYLYSNERCLMLVIKSFNIQGLIKFNLFELIKRNGKQVLKWFRKHQ